MISQDEKGLKMTTNDIKFSTEEAAAYLKISPKTLNNWRSQDAAPKSYKPVGKVYYFKSDLDSWIKKEGEA